ncbi:MAG: hypothetical protein ACK457_03885 [Flavobacteriia bacterium]|jgi:hypothetical protein
MSIPAICINDQVLDIVLKHIILSGIDDPKKEKMARYVFPIIFVRNETGNPHSKSNSLSFSIFAT